MPASPSSNGDEGRRTADVRGAPRLSQFDFRSRLKTWAYRVAVNFILDVDRPHRLAYVLGEPAEGLLGRLRPPPDGRTRALARVGLAVVITAAAGLDFGDEADFAARFPALVRRGL